MTLRIGLEVGTSIVRAVGINVSDGTIWCTAEVAVEAGDVESAVCTALQSLPRRRFTRAAVVAAIGADACQIKRLSGLPDVEPRIAEHIVREHQTRFFLRNGRRIETSAIWTPRAEWRWAAAFDEPVVSAVSRACLRSRTRFVAALPAILTVGRIAGVDRVVWPDSDTVAEAGFEGGELVTVERRRHRASSPAGLPALVPVAAVGNVYGAAYGAAVADPQALPAYREARMPAAPIPVRRRVRAMAALVAALVASLIAPLAANRRAESSARELARAIAPSARGIAASRNELRRFESALGAAAAFGDEARRTMAVLAELTRVLPESTAIVGLRMDSTGATIVLVTRRSGSVLSALDRSTVFTALEVIGPVTRESAAGHELERLTVRLRRSRPATRT